MSVIEVFQEVQPKLQVKIGNKSIPPKMNVEKTDSERGDKLNAILFENYLET